MTRTLRYLLLLVFIGLSGSAFAQGGEIAGKVFDEKKEGLINAAVQVYSGGIQMGGTVTDIDGNYLIKPLDPGYYDVLVLYTGYDSLMVTKVVVAPGLRTTQDFEMKRHAIGMVEFTKIEYKKKLVDQEKPGVTILDSKDIAQIPTTQVTDLVATKSDVHQSTRGGSVNMGGARVEGTVYIIDGVVVRQAYGSFDLSQGSVDQLEVMTSGIPANYGDLMGGVVNITSRGVSEKLTGDVRLQHSIDGYNNNLASFSIAGPIYKKTVMKDGKKTKKPVLGFALGGDYYNDHDRYPAFIPAYVTKGDVLSNLQKNPLKIVTDNSGLPVYNYASDYVTMKDFNTLKAPPHNNIQEDRLNGKLDYQLSDNMLIAAGGSFDYNKQDAYSLGRNLFAPEATPVTNTYSGRGYLRFRQKFGKSGDTSSRHNIISNAYYTIQADFQRSHEDQHDPVFKENFFDYAYIGKFNDPKTPIYFPLQSDSLTKKIATIFEGNAPTGITFDRTNTLNPVLANYTTQYFDYIGKNLPLFYNQIQASNALLNGDEPLYTYGMFLSPGSTQSAYIKQNSDQYALTVDASFDLLIGKTKHAIGFGLYYQQRIERAFIGYPNPNGSGTASIWQLMRQIVSSTDNGNLRIDKAHPIFRVNGQNYNYNTNGTFTDKNGNVAHIIPGTSDTIIYNYQNIGNSTFDSNLRRKIFASDPANMWTNDINIDGLAPSTFSLNMFSADELLNNGHPYIQYFGYTYTGQVQNGNVNFNDYWTKKDANGNYTRPIGAFSPNYIAGYIMDKFTYKDVHFNLGLRIDRYSSNEKVLIDPYSELPEKTVSQVSGAENLIHNGTHPGNMGGNYVVYVDDNTSSTPNVIGYRNGGNWYDANGNFINDPTLLKQFSGGRDPQPYLVKNKAGIVPSITDSSFNPNTSFTDYTPQVTLQPRIQFSFPISDVANFYAHYDIYAQRPTNNTRADASTYYFLQQNTNSVVINNPNLKPQKTFDYEVGFQQKLSEHSALTISAFYKERKDMITEVPYLFAYPATYYTFGNRDFSTTKGTTLVYDLRATNHLGMTVSYTLQFAEGTGSTPYSRGGLLANFIAAGVPNLRYISALDYDSRHNLVASIDYRYMQGEGPIVGGIKPLENAGVHFIAKARSGEPYSRLVDASGSNTVIGGINGSRLPWHYGLDMRLDKDFALNNSRKQKGAPAGVKPKRPLYLKAIIQANNLLQTRDVLGVYGYTGRPDDNGYLTSSYGHQFVPQQINPQSYTDMYQIAINNPGNYNFARTVSFALEFNF